MITETYCDRHPAFGLEGKRIKRCTCIPETPIQIGDFIFESLEDAIEFTGHPRKTIQYHLNKGTMHLLGSGRGNHGNHKSNRAVPFTVGPYSWPSKKAAAEALGWKPKTFCSMIQKGRMATILRRAMEKIDEPKPVQIRIPKRSKESQRSTKASSL